AVQSTPEQVAEATLDVLLTRVPKDVTGIVFLSGGQSPTQATANLAAICKSKHLPWPVTYSFSRAVQDNAIKAWGGKPENTTKAQAELAERLIANSAARSGDWHGKKSPK
ncbi:fructose-bisphosphate aldolase, partial [Candidatus Saccharibacteria bacterium]|nr:fructose-bisphosphate aldolase [Candidatus Saccharibacteria bacterium]